MGPVFVKVRLPPPGFSRSVLAPRFGYVGCGRLTRGVVLAGGAINRRLATEGTPCTRAGTGTRERWATGEAMADRGAGGKRRIRECANILYRESGLHPDVHIVLGSGLGAIAERVEDAVRIPFGGLPGFPPTSVEGHEGCFVIGRIGGTPVLVQSGRFHFYEGVGPGVVAAPVRLGRALGAETLVLTNAVGGIRRDLVPGSIVLVDDHINLMFRAPLEGPVAEGEERFPDMSRPCDPRLMELAESQALKTGTAMTRGTYAGVAGPHFETPAEVRALGAAGADVVGMSAVPEVTIARAGGQRVLAFSVVTNHAAGLGAGAIDHEGVMAYAVEAGERLGVLLERIVPLVGGDS